MESVFYLCGSIVSICSDDLQRFVLVLLVHCHFAHSSDDACVRRALKLWTVETVHLNTDGDGGGGKLERVYLLSSL